MLSDPNNDKIILDELNLYSDDVNETLLSLQADNSVNSNKVEKIYLFNCYWIFDYIQS